MNQPRAEVLNHFPNFVVGIPFIVKCLPIFALQIVKSTHYYNRSISITLTIGIKTPSTHEAVISTDCLAQRTTGFHKNIKPPTMFPLQRNECKLSPA